MIDMDVELMDGVVVNGVRVALAVASGGAVDSAATSVSGQTPDPEVRTVKRRFIRKTEDKLRVVREFDACKSVGEKGALLRREGIYSSYVYRWRDELDKRALLGLSNQKRGPKADPARSEKLRIAELEKENIRLEKELKKSRIIIDVQKKLSELLGIAQDPPTEDAQS